MKEKLDLPGWEVIPNKLDPSKSVYMHDGKLSSLAEYQEALSVSGSEKKEDAPSDPETVPPVSAPKRGRPRKETKEKKKPKPRQGLSKGRTHTFLIALSDEDHESLIRVKALMTLETGSRFSNDDAVSRMIAYYLENHKFTI